MGFELNSKAYTSYMYECNKVCNKARENCGTEKKDCSELGGYDPRDKCFQTCRISEADSCAEKCSKSSKTITFNDIDEKYAYERECRAKCRKGEEPVLCPSNFIDCNGYGGYDPKDVCK